jgi:hypothetical protein
MAVTVDEISTAVTVEPGPGGTPSGAPEHAWTRLGQFEAARDRLAEDERRVRAEGFDD